MKRKFLFAFGITSLTCLTTFAQQATTGDRKPEPVKVVNTPLPVTVDKPIQVKVLNDTHISTGEFIWKNEYVNSPSRSIVDIPANATVDFVFIGLPSSTSTSAQCPDGCPLPEDDKVIFEIRSEVGDALLKRIEVYDGLELTYKSIVKTKLFIISKTKKGSPLYNVDKKPIRVFWRWTI